MTRFCVNATVVVDAWTYIEAETEAEALAQAGSLGARDFEQGDAMNVTVESVERDE